MVTVFKRFAAAEDGAVTADWVVLTAVAAFLGIAVIGPLATGSLALGDRLAGIIASAQ